MGYVAAPANASPSAMRKWLAERLPSYMVPSYIVVLDSFPVASSGKIDLSALPPPYREEARLAAFRAPSDDREYELCAIWQEVLKIPKIGIDDDFFELGGASLQALMVFARIEARLGCSLSPATLVQAPTIARLAEYIRTTTGIAASQSLVPLRTRKSLARHFVVDSSARWNGRRPGSKTKLIASCSSRWSAYGKEQGKGRRRGSHRQPSAVGSREA